MMSLSSIIRKLLVSIPLIAAPYIVGEMLDSKSINQFQTTSTYALDKPKISKSLEQDSDSGIEVKFFDKLSAASQNICIAAKDIEGKLQGIKKIVLYEDDKPISTANSRFLITQVEHKTGKHEYYAVIHDLEGNEFQTRKRTVDFTPQETALDLFGIKEHEVEEGYSPDYMSIRYADCYDKNSLRFRFKDSTVIVPGFKDQNLNCVRCHSESEIKETLIANLRSTEQRLFQIWSTKNNVLPKTIVYNPGRIYRLSKEEEELLGKMLKDKEISEAKFNQIKTGMDRIAGHMSLYGDYIALRLKCDTELFLLHECTHFLQYEMPIRLSKDGPIHKSYTMYVTEPFTHYIELLEGDYGYYSWIIAEKTKKPDMTSAQVEYVFELVKAYGYYFDLDIETGKSFQKATEQLEKITLPLIHTAFNAYMQNVLKLDTLAIEAKSHEFPLEVLIAMKYEPVVPEVGQEELYAGLNICNSIWETQSTAEFNPQLLDELSNSYYAGSRDGNMTNVQDLEHLIKKGLQEAGFDKREVLRLYHEFLKHKFTDCKGNFNYTPAPNKIRNVLYHKTNRLWKSYINEYVESSRQDAVFTKFKDWEYMDNCFLKSRFYEEWKALRHEIDKYPTQIQSPTPGNE